jgi:hypothetical protein
LENPHCALGRQGPLTCGPDQSVSRISSAVLVHTKGRGSLFHPLIHLRMSASSSVTLRCTDRRSLRLVSSANQRSTRLSQLELVGGEVQVEPAVAQQPLVDFGGLVRAVVVADQVQVQILGDGLGRAR